MSDDQDLNYIYLQTDSIHGSFRFWLHEAKNKVSPEEYQRLVRMEMQLAELRGKILNYQKKVI